MLQTKLKLINAIDHFQELESAHQIPSQPQNRKDVIQQ